MIFTINNVQVMGIKEACQAAGYSFQTKPLTSESITEKDQIRAMKLGTVPTGSGHDSFLKLIMVGADITAPLYWWKQFQRYHFADIGSSMSTMHCILRMNLAEQCVPETDKVVLKRVQQLIDEYNAETVQSVEKWRVIIASCPCGLCLTARITTNYLQLKTMYEQRKNHMLQEWRFFCSWCDSLEDFKKLTRAD